MKKITLLFTGLIVLSFLSFISYSNKAASEASAINGIYIFTDSKPLAEYEVIGEVKIGFGSFNNSTYAEARNRLIELCKRDYPTGEGLLINAEKVSMKAKVIDFKE